MAVVGGSGVSSAPSSAEPNPLRLAAEPGAAREARAWLAGVLAGWPHETVEIARLAISELVTNSVLHTGTPVAVAFRIDGTRARFEVTDGQPAGPQPKRYGADAATGRGLRLVAAVADEWGVERGDEEKTVWFTVSLSTRPFASETASLPEDLDSYGFAPLAGHGEVERADRVTVTALGLPVDVYLEAEQHNDAVVRELRYCAEGDLLTLESSPRLRRFRA